MDGRVHDSLRRFATFLVGFSLLLITNADEEKGHEHAFVYLKNSSKGPEKLGSLKPEWQSCDSGKFQSPIDIPQNGVRISSEIGGLGRNYKPAPAVVKKRGHDVMVEWKGNAGTANVSGKLYDLLQCHWHTPSEHTIGGRRYNMELHMVHNSSDGEVAVISILYDLGSPDPFLEKVLAKMGEEESKEEGELGVVDPWEIKFGSIKYFRYLGSLTVPPCTQGDVWSLLNKVRTASREQIRALKAAYHDCFDDNARPLQPLNSRSVDMYRP